MTIAFACAASHAPGMTAWPDAAPAEQKARIYDAFGRLRLDLAAAKLDALVLLTSEHWANFFLDHIGGFCIGRADHYNGPIEPWLKVNRTRIAGAPDLAGRLIEHCVDSGFEPMFSQEMDLDHGSMVPLHFLTPDMDLPVVPVIFNTLAAPQPTAARCLEFGKTIGRFLEQDHSRIGLIATGGLSHSPGERNHGYIDTQFDQGFMQQMAAGDMAHLGQYARGQLGASGSGTFELLAWIALAGALNGRKGEILAYEAIVPWATGIGLMSFAAHAAIPAAALPAR